MLLVVTVQARSSSTTAMAIMELPPASLVLDAVVRDLAVVVPTLGDATLYYYLPSKTVALWMLSYISSVLETQLLWFWQKICDL